MCQALDKKHVEYVVACYLGQGPCYPREDSGKNVHALQQSFSNVIWWKETPLLHTLARLKWSEVN